MTLAEVARNQWGTAEGDIGLVEIQCHPWDPAQMERRVALVVGRSRQTMRARATRQVEATLRHVEQARVVHVFGEADHGRDHREAIEAAL